MSEQAITIRPCRLLTEIVRLLRPFLPLVRFSTAIGTLGAPVTAWLPATIINTGLHDCDGITWPLLAYVAGTCLLSVGGTAIADVRNSVVGQSIIAALRKHISARILRAPIAALEAERSDWLMSVLAGDVDTASTFTFNTGYAIAIAIAVGSVTYLLMLSLAVFLIALAGLGVGIVINIVAKRVWIRDYEGVRIAQGDLRMQYRAITNGAKGLKISSYRRGRVHGLLLSGTADRINDLKSRPTGLFWIANPIGSAVFFVVIGLLIVSRERLGIDGAAISGVVIVLLYLKGPVAQLAGALPVFEQARIAFMRIAVVSAKFDRYEPNIPMRLLDGVPSDMAEVGPIELRGLRCAFPAEAGSLPFSLDPIDLTVHAGELVFIVGEDGSGKTTPIKLLLRLYAPQQGSILLHGEDVAPDRRDQYRQLFSTIFSDHYLFNDLVYGTLPEEAVPHLPHLSIVHKVRLEGDHFITTDLSSEQRKRVALAQAWLEHRPIVVTDEWAADQAPEFRRVFYKEVLAELKAQGWTLIAIGHDDRVEDQFIRMADGSILEHRSTDQTDSELSLSGTRNE